MTTMNVASAYPAPIEALMPEAQELAARLGAVPSRNRIMTELKVGAPKARAILAALTEPTHTDNADPADPAPVAPGAPGETTTSTPPAAAAEPEAPEALSADDHAVTGETTSEAVQAERPADPDPATEPEPVAALPVVVPADPAVTPDMPAMSVGIARWPLLLLALPAFVAIWGGWVGLGGMSGFGMVQLLPGIADSVRLNTAITLPIGMETYAAYALKVWLTPGIPRVAREFAKWSACGALLLGALGQVAYHLMAAAHLAAAPWPITTLVACLPVAVLGCAAALIHLIHTHIPADITERAGGDA